MDTLRETAKKVLAVVDCGLAYGKGQPEPGQMCVEAAVCYAMGLPHSDNPPCVAEEVRALKISLNDKAWFLPGEDSSVVRARGLRRLAIAQLGTDSESFSGEEFYEKTRSALESRCLSSFSGLTTFLPPSDPLLCLNKLAVILSCTELTKFLFTYAEDVVQILIEMKAPGALIVDELAPLPAGGV